MLCVIFGWVLFRADGGNAAIGYVQSMLGLTGNPGSCDLGNLTFREYWLFLIMAVLFSTALPGTVSRRLSDSGSRAVRLIARTLLVALYIFCFLWAVSFIIIDAYNPFIYFNF